MSNFLTDYYTYIKGSESPENFHFWSALSAISALLGRKCSIPQGHFRVYPNLYVVLVGEAASRKSTAMDSIKNLLRAIPDVKFAPSSVTRESLIDSLADSKVTYKHEGVDVAYYPQAIFTDELAQLLGGQHIQKTNVDFLVAIFGCGPFEEKTRRGGLKKVPAPYVTMLTSTQPSWVMTHFRNELITEGFSRRVLFVREFRNNVINPWPTLSVEQRAALDRCVQHVKGLAKLSGDFDFTGPARQLWDKFYRQSQTAVESKPEALQYYWSARHIHVQKIAMCLSACYRDDMLVDSGLLDFAIKCIESSERNLPGLFGTVGRNELGGYADKIYDFVRAKERKKSVILRTFFKDLSLRELNEVLEMLVGTGRLQLASSGTVLDPTYAAVTSEESQARDHQLFQLANRVQPLHEDRFEDSADVASSQAPDLALERVVAHLEQRQHDLRRGILLRGRKSHEDQK